MTGILNDYSGGSVAAAYNPSTPYSNAAQNPQVVGVREGVPLTARDGVPGGLEALERQGDALDAVPRPEPALLLLVLEGRPVHRASPATRRVPQGNIHFAGEHCSTDFQGFMEGGASEGIRAADEVLDALR